MKLAMIGCDCLSETPFLHIFQTTVNQVKWNTL